MKQQKQYHAQLKAHANVPEDPSIQLDINYSIIYRIYCPISKCTFIKKDGPDHNHKLNLQKFQCNVHHIHFYAHTSYVIFQLAKIIVYRILSQLFAGKTPAVELADRYHLNPSTISKLIHQSQNFVDQVIDKIKRSKQIPQEQSIVEGNSEDTQIIWIDEMFFKVGKQKFALIIAINNDYHVVGWKLSSTTNSKDIEDVLQQVDQSTETWSILIGDGNNAYPKAIKERRKNCYLIQHIHSKPKWQVSRIHKFTNEKDGSLSHVTVEVNYNVFTEIADDQIELGHAVKKSYLPEVEAKKRGRRKGSKNKPKGSKSEKSKNEGGKRGPITPKSQGNVFSVSHDNGFLDVRWITHPLQADTLVSNAVDGSERVNEVLKKHKAPHIQTIQEMLFVTFAVFKGKAIVSNLIESMNALVRNVIPVHGLKTEEHLYDHSSILMRIHSKPVNSADLECQGELMVMESILPISPRVGLTNITRFMKLDFAKIGVITSYGGDL